MIWKSRAALSGYSNSIIKNISFKIGYTPSCFHTLALGDFFNQTFLTA
nr:MAG TPA: hypothetical protein [Bacteriophage sp.]